MGIVNKNQTLYLATGIDTTGLYAGSRKALEIIRKMATQITSLDIFGEKGIDMGRVFSQMVADVYTFEKEFRKNMLEVATVSAQVSGNMTESMNQVVELTRRIPVSASDAAKALYEIASAGYEGVDGMNILEVSSRAAVGGFTDAATAANAITTVLNAYNMSAHNAEQVSDQLFATIRLGKTTFKDLNNSMTEIIPLAASYGVEINEVLAAFASLTRSGRSGSQAVTQIKAVLEAIPIVLGNDALDKLTLQEALKSVVDHANNSESALRSLLPTAEAVNGVLGLTGIHANTVASNLNVLHNSTGATTSAFQQMLDSIDNQMSLLANNVYAVLRPLGTNVLQEASTIAKAFNEAFADGRVQAALKHLGDLVVIVGSAFAGYKGAVMATTLAQRLNMAVLRQAVLERQLEKAALLTTGGAYDTLTIAQLKQIATKKLLVSAVRTHTAAMLKNTAAVLTNPYVLAAAAVAILGYAFYKSITQMSAAEQAQKQLNEEQKKAVQRKSDLISKTNELTAKINGETESVYAQVKAYKELVELVPELKGITFEEFKAMPQSQQKAMLNKIAEKNEMEEAEKKYSEDLQKIERLKEAIAQTALLPNSGFSLSKLNEQLEIAQKLAEGHKAQIEEIKQIQWEANTPVEQKVQHYKELLSSLEKEREELNAQVNPVKVMASYAENLSDTWMHMPDLINRIRLDILNKRIDETAGKINSLSGNGNGAMLMVDRNKSYWEGQKANALSTLEAIDSRVKELLDKGRNSEAKAFLIDSRKTQTEADAVVNSYNNSVKKLNEANKNLKIYDFSADGDLKKQKNFESQKQIEQKNHEELLSLRRQNQQDRINLMREGHEKEIAQIELDYDKEITAILTKENEWKQAQRGKLTSEQTTEIHTSLTNAWIKKEKATSDVDKNERETEKQAMNEYLSEYGTYLQKRQAITDMYQEKMAHASLAGERLSLGEEMKRELAQVDEEAQKKTSAISRLFFDMSKCTVSDMRAVAEEAQNMLDYLKGGQFKTGENGEGLFGLTKEQFDVYSQSPDKLESLETQIVTVKDGADKASNSFNKMGNGLKKMFSSGSDSKKLKESLDEIQTGMQEIMQVGEFVSGALSNLGEAFGSDALQGIAQGINVAMDAANATMQGAQAGAMFGPIGASAGAALGLVSSLASSIAKIHDAKNEKRIVRLQEQIDILERSYDKLGKAIEKAYSSDASNLIGQQNEALQQQKILIQQQIKEEESKKKTDENRIKEWKNQLEDIDETIAENKEKAQNAIFGEDVKTAIDNFAQAYVDAWAAGENRSKSMKDVVKKMIKGVIVEMMKSNLAPTVQNLRNKIEAALSDGILSDYEQTELDRLIEQASSDMDSKYGWADKYLKGEEKEPSREASAKGIASMSQESANELNGNFNSLLVYSNRTADNTSSIRESMGYILEIQKNGWGDVRIIKELTGQVRAHTEQLTTLSGLIASNTQRVAAGMDILTMNGLTLKR